MLAVDTSVDTFLEAFQGFPYAYGASGDRPHCVWDEVTPDLVAAHLGGTKPIGVYPMVYDPRYRVGGPAAFSTDRLYRYGDDRSLWMCRWGCVDIDAQSDTRAGQGTADECLEAGWALADAIGSGSFVERTRSGGAHVWLFVDDWVRCDDMRGFLGDAVARAGVRIDGIFPRADRCGGPPGNFVRLPYFGAAETGRLTMVNRQGRPISFADFLEAVTD